MDGLDGMMDRKLALKVFQVCKRQLWPHSLPGLVWAVDFHETPVTYQRLLDQVSVKGISCAVWQ